MATAVDAIGESYAYLTIWFEACEVVSVDIRGDFAYAHRRMDHVTAYGSAGAILAENNLNDWTYPYGAANILKLIRKLVLTGEVDDSMGDMVEAVAVVNAGRLSLAEGSRAVRVARTE
jgi:hypothetical protein